MYKVAKLAITYHVTVTCDLSNHEGGGIKLKGQLNTWQNTSRTIIHPGFTPYMCVFMHHINYIYSVVFIDPA